MRELINENANIDMVTMGCRDCELLETHGDCEVLSACHHGDLQVFNVIVIVPS